MVSLLPRSLAVRDLDGIPFEVMILRPAADGATYDVIYLDDGNVERSVALSDLDPTGIAGGASHPANLDHLMQVGLKELEHDPELVKNFDSKTNEGEPILASVVRSTEEMSKFLIDDDVSVCHTARSASLASGALGRPGHPDHPGSPSQSLASTASTLASESGGYSSRRPAGPAGFKLMQAPIVGEVKAEAAPPNDEAEAQSAAEAAAAATAAATATACGAGVRGIRSLRRSRSSAGLA